MKKVVNFIGFFVLALVFGFTVTGCGGDSDDPDGPVIITKTSIKVKQFPVSETTEYDGYVVSLRSLYPNEYHSINDNFENALCMVNNGKLQLNLGIPDGNISTDLDERGFGDSYSNNAKVLFVSYFRLFHAVGGSTSYFHITLKHKSIDTVYVMLVYAVEATEIHGYISGAVYNHIKLKKGWNTLLGDQVGVVSNVTVDSNYEWVVKPE